MTDEWEATRARWQADSRRAGWLFIVVVGLAIWGLNWWAAEPPAKYTFHTVGHDMVRCEVHTGKCDIVDYGE